MIQNKDIRIQKADKGNIIVAFDKRTYENKMKTIISDCSKFENFDIQEEKHLYFVPNKVKRLIKPLNHCLKKTVLLKVSI